MVELAVQRPLTAHLPVSAGSATLADATPDFITSIQARSGKAAALSKAVKVVHGIALPKIGQVTGTDNTRLIWFGTDQYLLIGKAPADPGLSAFAAITNQSDAWTVMHLSGASAADVLARLCPLDLRSEKFGPGHTARSMIADLPSVVTPIHGGFAIMLLQSLAKSALHDLHGAMESLAGQAKLS